MKYKIIFSLFLLSLLSQGYAQNTPLPKHDEVITITTPLGDMVAILFDATPKHKANFIKLAKEGYYNGTTFHRIISDFMIQGGDPNSKDSIADNDGMGGPGYTLPNEINPKLKHEFGRIAAARMGDGVNPNKESSGSQFYIVQNHQGTPHLDNAYTVFGQIVSGIEVIDKIAAQSKNFRDRPEKNIVITMKVKKMKRKKVERKYHCKDLYLLQTQ